MKTLIQIIGHDEDCTWYMTDGDICNCPTKEKVKEIKEWALRQVGEDEDETYNDGYDHLERDRNELRKEIRKDIKNNG
jgi:hypothetical protein